MGSEVIILILDENFVRYKKYKHAGCDNSIIFADSSALFLCW